MKISEFLTQVFGDKEVEPTQFGTVMESIRENTQTEDIKKDTESAPIQVSTVEKPPTISIVDRRTKKELLDEIDQLKAANRALLTGQDVPEHEESVEALIYSLVGGGKKEA